MLFFLISLSVHECWFRNTDILSMKDVSLILNSLSQFKYPCSLQDTIGLFRSHSSLLAHYNCICISAQNAFLELIVYNLRTRHELARLQNVWFYRCYMFTFFSIKFLLFQYLLNDAMLFAIMISKQWISLFFIKP